MHYTGKYLCRFPIILNTKIPRLFCETYPGHRRCVNYVFWKYSVGSRTPTPTHFCCHHVNINSFFVVLSSVSFTFVRHYHNSCTARMMHGISRHRQQNSPPFPDLNSTCFYVSRTLLASCSTNGTDMLQREIISVIRRISNSVQYR